MYKQVLKSKESEGQVLVYQPKNIVHGVPEQALGFAKKLEEAPEKGFEMNSLVAQNTGLSDLERKNFHTKLEEEVLSRLKAVEEKAYAEAYALGLQDGRNKAFDETKATIQSALERLEQMVRTLGQIKKTLLVDNEKHIVETIFHIAKGMALQEIKQDPTAVRSVLTKALENAQAEEELTLRISPQDASFLETIKKEAGNPLERVQKLHIEVSESVTPGGCVLETNYGVIDATVETRIEKVKEVMESKIPKSSEGA